MKKLLIIGAVLLLVALLAVPASAIWSNGNWVTDEEYAKLTKGNTVKYDPVTDVSSKYGNKPDINLMTNQGMVKGILKSGSVVSGGERFLFHRVGTPDNVTLAQYFGPDGLYTGYLAPGEYDVILPQGTGSACGIYSDDWGYVGNPHEERTRITVVVGKIAPPFVFIGNSFTGGESCKPRITVIDADYCWDAYTVHVDEVYTYVGHNHGDYDWVDAMPAHYEIVSFGSYDGKCKVVAPWEPYDFAIGPTHYRIGTGMSYNLKYRYHTEVPGHYEYVGHHHGDYTYTSAHDEVVAGSCVDVTQNVKDSVAQGYSSFVFQNAAPYHGIYDETMSTLLSDISDPSVGHLKTATIKYNTGCGASDKTTSKVEGQTIILN